METLRFQPPASGEAVHPLTLKNHADEPLVLDEKGIEITGPDAELFQLLPRPQLPMSLSPRESLSFAIFFNPGEAASVGEKTAVLSIRSADESESSTRVQLIGEVIPDTGPAPKHPVRLVDLLSRLRIASAA